MKLSLKIVSLFVCMALVTEGMCQSPKEQLSKVKSFDGWASFVAKWMSKGVHPGKIGVDLFRSERKLMKPKDTQRLIELLKFSMKDEKLEDYTSTFVNLLWYRGEEKLSIPIFYSIATQSGENWRPLYGWKDHSISALMKSSHALATQYKLQLLASKDTTSSLKRQAYCSVAGTGNQKAIETVLAMRKKIKTIEPLRTRVGLGQLQQTPKVGIGSKFLATGSDASGAKWLLMACGEAGSCADLWLTKWDGKAWETPVFTGINVYSNSAEPKIDGMAIEEWLKKDWLKLSAQYEVFNKDSDNDGLTDLIERRLGTNATDPDSDQDTDQDNIDPNPLSGIPIGSEDEDVLKAAFEAWMLFEESSYPYVVLLPKSAGHPDLTHEGTWVLVYPEKSEAPITKLFGQGPVFVHFIERNGRTVRYAAGRKEAVVEMSVGYHPLNGSLVSLRLRKFGQDWIVISIKRSGSA